MTKEKEDKEKKEKEEKEKKENGHMGLDRMFGKGTAKQFAERVTPTEKFPGVKPTIVEAEMENGGVSVNTVWRNAAKTRIAAYALDYHLQPAIYVYCSALEVEPAFRGKGFLLVLMKSLEPWWNSIGIEFHTMSVIPGSEGEKMLLSSGFYEYRPGKWGCPIPAIRPKEYLQWVQEGSPPAKEPAWRKELELPNTEVF